MVARPGGRATTRRDRLVGFAFRHRGSDHSDGTLPPGVLQSRRPAGTGGVAAVGSDSQVIEPSGFFLMYLYWSAVFAGSDTVADEVGIVGPGQWDLRGSKMRFGP